MQFNFSLFTYLGITILCIGAIILVQACGTKSHLEDNTQMEILVLAQLKKNTKANQISSDLSDYKFVKSSLSNKTINEVLFKVILRGQSGEDLLNEMRNHPLVVNAKIAPKGKTGAQNLPGGKVTRTGPIKGR